LKVIPAIDIVSKRVARLYMGDINKATVYHIKPLDALRKWEREGAEIVHVVDLDAAHGRGSNMETILQLIAEANVEVQVAGGIRSVDKALTLLEAGAARVVIGTIFIERPEVAEEMVRQAGGDRVVVALGPPRGQGGDKGLEGGHREVARGRGQEGQGRGLQVDPNIVSHKGRNPRRDR
jgi:phosphoribosylformimino-5-aminoimidazole carboxamide ribotide isomerase